MNCDNHSEKPGATIKPVARPSIHNHGSYCPFATIEAMGGYGLKNNNNKKSECRTGDSAPSANQEDGIDELDNIMSKLAHSSSPVTMNKRNTLRRNSMSAPCHEYTEDSEDSNVFAKSLPANLPSHSIHYSDEYGNWPIDNEHQKSTYSNSSQESLNYTSTPECSRNNRCRYNESKKTDTSYPNSAKSLSRKREVNDYESRSRYKMTLKQILVPIMGALVIAAAYYYNILRPVQGSNTMKYYDEAKFYNDVNTLGKKYNIKENTILQLQTGISTIFEREDAGSFIFVYNSGHVNFNPTVFNNFINTFALNTAKYLRNESTAVQHIVIEESDFDMHTHSELINKYREKVTNYGVMLVREIDRVPSALAMAFHYYCDEYNPLVRKSAILFTLNSAKCANKKGRESTHAFVEKCLSKKWNSVPQDNIGPLLTRIVSIVIDVTSEF